MRYVFYILFFSAMLFEGFAQQTEIRTDSLRVSFSNRYEVSAVSVIPQSEIIRLRRRILQPGEYTFDYLTVSFSLSDTLPYSILDTLIVTYRTYPVSLKKMYNRRELVIQYNQENKDSVFISRPVNPFTSESIFGPNLQKSGTLIRGFTIGTNKDLSLQSGLRLQLSGNLSDDIEIVAALTDENTPIQPEGNTERLDELDKVFIQVKHPNAIGTFGDYDLLRRTGEFGIVNRRMQGLMGEVNYAGYNAFVGIAASKGKFNSNAILGLDGVQGPYRLSGINNERDIIVIAGSERVFLDGEEMRRGENNDYIIDYSNSQITFTTNRLITASSRISVDFEYTDRRYERNIFGTGAGTTFFDKRLSVNFLYLSEGDNKDAPIDMLLSDADKEVLRNAGDDRTKAAKSGVSLALPDSLGVIRGVYEQRDSLINGDSITYYYFSPGSPDALYNVSFSYIGENKGDYVKRSIGDFYFVGKNAGSYLPIIFLPMPEQKQFGTLYVTYQPVPAFTLSLEIAGSSFDKNTFSSVDENDNSGYARNIVLKLDPLPVAIGDVSLGKYGVTYRDRFVEGRFTSVDRFNSVEFDRDYNISAGGNLLDESLRELTVTAQPLSEISITSSLGILKKGEQFTSTRSNSSLAFGNRSTYSLSYSFDYVNSENPLTRSSWIRQRGSAFYRYSFLKPGIDFLAEDKNDTFTGVDSVISGSLRYYEVSPFLSLIELGGFDVTYKYILRSDYQPVNGLLVEEAKSTGQQIELNFRGVKEFSSVLRVTLRNKSYSQLFKEKGLLNNETVLIRSQSQFLFGKRFAKGDLFYEVSTERTAKLERVFVKVEKGKGNYKYLGDLNNNGIADENEFELTLYDGEFVLVTIPSEELYPVIDLRTGTRWKFTPEELFDKGTIGSILLSPITTETTVRIEEKSSEQNLSNIYFLHFSSFLNEQTTLRGSQIFQQDVNLFENDPIFSLRLRYSKRRSLTQYSAATERGFGQEKSVRLKFRLAKELSLQADLIQTDDNLAAEKNSNRMRELHGLSGVLDFSYRPESKIEVGFKLTVGDVTDVRPAVPTEINFNGQALRFTYSFAESGRLRIEFERNEYEAKAGQNFIPFEMTNGNQIGKNYLWRVQFDYKIAANLQSNASYEGRWQGSGRVIHQARAEIRAYF